MGKDTISKTTEKQGAGLKYDLPPPAPPPPFYYPEQGKQTIF